MLHTPVTVQAHAGTRRTLALVVALGSSGLAQAQELAPEQLFEKISPSIWVVTTFDATDRRLAQGSAVVIDKGTLVTNCHVLAKARSMVVKRDNVAYGATLEHADVERDLCQIQARNFNAPAVEIASTAGLRVGQKVYAIGNPRGLELTFSDGLVSGLRKAADDKTVELVQTTAPISPGSSGGGLFDSQGRLVGVTTATRRESQNLNFAMPAEWVKDLPTRSRDALARRQAGETRVSSAGPTTQRQGPYHVGQTWTYTVTDRMTGRRQPVQLRVDRFDDGKLVFNGGGRVENTQGKVLSTATRELSELDALNLEGGWIHGGTADRRAWSIDTVAAGQPENRLQLDAVFAGESRITLPAGEFDVRVYRFSGYRRTSASQGPYATNVAYEATAWFAPALNRIVRFSATTRGNSNRVDEEVVLESFDR